MASVKRRYGKGRGNVLRGLAFLTVATQVLPGPSHLNAQVSRWTVAPVPEIEIGGSDLELNGVTGVALISEGRLVIADAAPRLVVLDRLGAIDTVFGRAGLGPGEFRQITWIQALPSDTIIVYDGDISSRRVSYFSVYGYGRSVTLEQGQRGLGVPNVVAALADGRLVAARSLGAPQPEGGIGIVRPRYVLELYSRDGIARDTIGRTVGDEAGIVEGVIVPTEFGRKTLFRGSASRLYVTESDSFQVRVLDLESDRERRIQRVHRPRPVTRAMIGDRTGIRARFPEPSHMPAISGMVIADSGELWVGEFSADDESPKWYVYSPDGTEIATLQMPKGFEPFSVRGNRVAGVWKDEFDVEYVGVYSFTR